LQITGLWIVSTIVPTPVAKSAVRRNERTKRVVDKYMLAKATGSEIAPEMALAHKCNKSSTFIIALLYS
jgi:hypothetical protein